MCVNDCKWARSHSTLHIHADICMTSLTVFRTPVQLLLPSCMEKLYLYMRELAEHLSGVARQESTNKGWLSDLHLRS